MTQSIISLQIVVEGEVQNVGFRYKTKEQATRLGLKGFVKNQKDGKVYIEVEGPENLIDIFKNWCKTGPDWARVDNVTAILQPLCNYSDFSIQR